MVDQLIQLVDESLFRHGDCFLKPLGNQLRLLLIDFRVEPPQIVGCFDVREIPFNSKLIGKRSGIVARVEQRAEPNSRSLLQGRKLVIK